MQGKGKCPLPLQPIPKTNNKTNNKTKVVYTEDWTHPSLRKPDPANRHWRPRRPAASECRPSAQAGECLPCASAVPSQLLHQLCRCPQLLESSSLLRVSAPPVCFVLPCAGLWIDVS